MCGGFAGSFRRCSLPLCSGGGGGGGGRGGAHVFTKRCQPAGKDSMFVGAPCWFGGDTGQGGGGGGGRR